MKKLIFLIVALLGSSYSLHSLALTLGDIQVKSTLGQPLLARVKVNGADSNIDESCFNVSSEDPENGVMLKYNQNDAIITIQSQQTVANPAMVLTLFNDCQAPSKRNYIFFVNAQESGANSQNTKNETPKKLLGDQFHYQRTFNKLTKQTEQEFSARGLPDRIMYEDQARDSRPNSRTSTMPSEDIQINNDLSAKEFTKGVDVLGNKPSKSTKTKDNLTSKTLKSATIEAKTASNQISSVSQQKKSQPAHAKPNAESKLALDKPITATPSKTTELKPSEPKTSGSKTTESKTKSILNVAASNSSDSAVANSPENNVNGNSEGELQNAEEDQLISEEQRLAEERMLELQTQLTELYKINNSLDNLFKKMNHELKQVKKENNFLRSLALCLGGALLMSSYFFADWLRRKKSQPVFDSEPAIWTSQTTSAKPNADSPPESNIFTEATFVTAGGTMSPSSPLPHPSNANNHPPQAEEHRLSEQATETKWFDLGEPVTATAEQAIETAPSDTRPFDTHTPVDISATLSPTQAKATQPPILTITRVASPLKSPESTPDHDAVNSTVQATATAETNSTEPIKDVIKVQPAGVLDDVDVFLSHGRTNLAIQLLQNYLMEHPKESAVVWILLLDLLAKEGKRREYEVATEECRKHFNIKLSDFSVPTANNDSIESFERISAALQKVWGTPLVLSFIDELIYNTRLVPRIGFNRAIFEELMLLRELAEEELRMNQTQLQPTPASMTERPVSDEFKQLAEDLKGHDERKQDVNQYLSQFEFDLEDLSK